MGLPLPEEDDEELLDEDDAEVDLSDGEAGWEYADVDESTRDVLESGDDDDGDIALMDVRVDDDGTEYYEEEEGEGDADYGEGAEEDYAEEEPAF